MRVEEAIYGEVMDGHTLRAASGDESFARSIAPRLDLPDNAPPGVLWSPFISGFPHGERYVLARTFADTGASRAGMVLAHALIMPTAELVQFRNLSPLFGRLIQSVNQAVTPTGFNHERDEGTPNSARDLIGAANVLSSRPSGPVVRLGIEGFEALVVSLWANLWPETRTSFSFRLSFGPADIPNHQAPTLVCSPEPLQARWSRYSVLRGEDESTVSQAAGYIAGEISPTPLLDFARNIGADLRQISQLPLLDKAHTLLSKEGGINDVLPAVRLLEKLSPDPAMGIDAKRSIVSRLTAQVASSNPEQILAMRNLALKGFPAAPDLWRAIERWIAAQPFEHTHDQSMIQIAASATSNDTAVEAWRKAVERGVAAAARQAASELPKAIWRWVCMRPDLLNAILRLLPNEYPVEFRLASATSTKLTPELANNALQISLKRQWLVVHGALVSAISSPIEAARRQLSVDDSRTKTDGVKFALRLATPAQLLECAVQLRDRRLVDLAADAIAAAPVNFSGTLCRDIVEQMIWDAMLRLDSGLWEAPSDPFAARNTVFSGLIQGGKVHMPLVESLAWTPLADLYDFPHREQLWGSVSHKYLEATAEGWLRRSAEGDVSGALDPVLKTTILYKAELDEILLDRSTEISVAVRIVEALDGFDEQRFLVWFKTLLSQGRALPIGGMEALGRLALKRSWHRVVSEMASRYYGRRSEIRPALRACSSMLPIMTQWLYDLSAPTISEKWKSFAHLAAELYPGGPDQDELWSRAGGRNSDLEKNGSGLSVWLKAASQMRNGRAPTPHNILQEMLQDYPGNEALYLLNNDPDIVGYR